MSGTKDHQLDETQWVRVLGEGAGRGRWEAKNGLVSCTSDYHKRVSIAAPSRQSALFREDYGWFAKGTREKSVIKSNPS